jgi:hypothetical protein
VILPDTAQKFAGLQIGASGDPVPLMIQGQTFNLDGDDQTGGLWLAPAMDESLGAASGLIYFFIALQE